MTALHLLITAMMTITVLNTSCKNSLRMKVAKNEASSAEDSSPKLQALTPRVAAQGTLLTATGQNLSKLSSLTVDEQEVLPSEQDDERVTFILPPGKNGPVKVRLAEQSDAELAVYRLDNPTQLIATMDASQVCSDIQFLNSQGQLVSGTRNCAGSSAGQASGADSHAACTAGNQTNCLATSSFPTMDKSAASVMTDDLSAANFLSKLASAVTFEFWDGSGTRQQFSGSSSLRADKILAGTTIFGVTGTAVEKPASAATIIQAMGPGFNLGQTFEQQGNSTDPATIKPLIDLYYNAGFRHVRLPVTWMETSGPAGFGGDPLADATGTINFSHARFLQLKEVIDYIISKNMYVVLNAHHEHWLKNSYDGTDTYNLPFRKLWTQIATYFKNYPALLTFEALNEPDGALGEWGGAVNPFDATAIGYTRQLNQIAYEAIRLTSGNNSTRIIFVLPNAKGNQDSLDEIYPSSSYLPGLGNDSYLAAAVNTYDPWNFCGETGSDSNYPGNTTISSAITAVIDHAQTLGIPVRYSEFGVGRSGAQSGRDTSNVRAFYRTVAQTLLARNMAPTYWDDRGWFALTESDGNGGYNFVFSIVPTSLAP